jgi:hypothetical protein
MARTYLVFGDIDGKLDVLRVECARCQRKGRYHVRKLIEKHHGRRTRPVRSRPRFERELCRFSLPLHRPATGELLNHPLRSAGPRASRRD